MAQQVRRQMNYVDGTAGRQMYAAGKKGTEP